MERHELQLRELTGLLDRERRLVGALCDALARQRSGLAYDDRALVEASTAEVGRIVAALELARRTRARWIGAITGDEAFPLARLEERVGVPLPEGFLRARADLREAAQAAAVEAGINHAVLCRAVEAGEALMPGLYAPLAGGTPPKPGAPDDPSGTGARG